MADALDAGRESFLRHRWADAYANLVAAQGEAALALDDLERLAAAAHLVGDDRACADAWARAHAGAVKVADANRAARCAFWLAFGLLSKGEVAHASGLLARTRQMIDRSDPECAGRGYLQIPAGLARLADGDPAGADAAFTDVAEIGDWSRDPDLMTFGRLGRAQALIGLGDSTAAVALLDELMVAVTTDEVSAVAVGIVYCAAIEACQQIFDPGRAQEWTAALSHWCDAQPDLVPYRGQCLVHRAEIMQLHGAWTDAIAEAQRACDRLAGEPAVGAAFYQRGELRRLRGELDEAEDAYRQASRWGREPQPGLALLRLAQGQTDAAMAAIRRVVDETEGAAARATVLGPYVEIALAAHEVTAARLGADELGAIAASLDAPFLQAVAAQADGAVRLGEGDARAALPVLRRAWAVWRDLDVPYDATRVRVLVALACRTLGDEDTAAMELDAARSRFDQLGAAPDVARVDTLAGARPGTRPAGLTAREVEVLALVATGLTNRDIASALIISENTVARHLQNIFVKLGVSSRTAASAFAFAHHVV